MRKLALLIFFVTACYIPPRPAAPLPSPAPLQLPSPISLKSSSLLPPENPPIALSAQLKEGSTVGPGFYLSKDYAAALGGELERLAGLPKAYQDGERERAALVIEEGNKQVELYSKTLEEERAERLKAEKQAAFWHKAAFPIALSSAAAGMLLATFLLTY